MRKQTEIDRMIKALLKQREALPEINFFNENNHILIDTQIEILEGKILSEDEVYDREDEFSEGQPSDVCQAFDWLHERIKDEDLVDAEYLENIEEEETKPKLKVCSKLCGECPFSNKSIRGWLTDYTIEDIKTFQRNDGLFPCHKMVEGDGLSQAEVSKAIEAGEMKMCRGYVESIVKSAKLPQKGSALYEAYLTVKAEGTSEKSMTIWDFEKHHTVFQEKKKK